MSNLATVREAVITEIQDWVYNKTHRPDFWPRVWSQIQAGEKYLKRYHEAQAVVGCWSDTKGPASNEELRLAYLQARELLRAAAAGPGFEAGEHARIAVMALLCAVHNHGTYIRSALLYWWEPLLTDQSLADDAIRKRIKSLLPK